MRVVVSLTTIPGRETLLKRAIASLHRQTRRPDAIHLWLPVERFGTDRAVTRFAGVQTRSGADLGPAMKILPLLPIETDPETLIIPVDDDVEYPPELIDKLVHTSVIFPDRAIGFTGWNAIKDADKTQIHHLNEDVACAAMFQRVHVLEGYRGVSYRRGFFEPDIFEHLKALDAFRFHDDILLSGYLASRGIIRSVRWFGTSPAPPGNYWRLNGQDIGLHTELNWFEQGMACLDYWTRHFPGIFQPIATHAKSERLQLGVNDNLRDGFLHHAQPGTGTTGDVTHDLNVVPWPWPDGCFQEILALDIFQRWPLATHWLAECWRILKPGGVLKVRLPQTIASGHFFHGPASPDEAAFCTTDANNAWGIRDGFRYCWEYERGQLVGTLLKS